MKYSEIRKLAELELITPAQASAICTHLKLSPHESRNYLLITFCLLGGALLLTGTIMVISANWAEIPALAKQISCAAIMLALWVAGLRFLFRRENPRPFFGESLCFVGAGMWLANIALYGQIYQISSEPENAFGSWFLAIFALPWIVRLRGVFAMSLGAATIWLFLKLTHVDGDGTFSYLSFLAFFTGVSALGIFLCGLGKANREKVSGYGEIAFFPAFAGLILLAQVNCYGAYFPDYENTTLLKIVIAAGALSSVLLFSAIIYSFRKKLNEVGYVLAAIIGAFPIVPLILTLSNGYGEAGKGIMMLALFVCGVAAMMLGARVLRKSFVNAGAAMILLSAIALTVETVESLASSGFALIFAGTLLLAFGFVLERQWRKITKNIKKQQG